MKLNMVQLWDKRIQQRKPKASAKYSKKDQKYFNYRKAGHFKREYQNPTKEYEKKWDNYKMATKRTIQMASKDKMPATKREMEESSDGFLQNLMN